MDEHALARRVAEATDAHLRDPLDVHAYELMVHAVQRWRAHSTPTLDGLGDVGRPTLEALSAASEAASRVRDDSEAPDDPKRRPVAVGGVVGEVIAGLRRPVEGGLGYSEGDRPDGQSPSPTPA